MEEPTQESEFQPNEKLWTKKNVLLLLGICYCSFALGSCFSLPAPFFPKEAHYKGATSTQYGLVFGVFQLAYLIMSPVWGKLMPHLVPKLLLITGVFVAGSCSVLFGILEFCPPGAPFIALSFCVRTVEAIGATAYTTTIFSLIPVLFPKHTATVLSTTESMFGFGLIAGPTIGGALYQVGGYHLPFSVMGGVLIVGTIVTALAFRDHGTPPREKTGSLLKMVSSPILIMDILVFGMGFVCIGFNDATLEPHLRQFNLTPAAVGGVFIITGGIYALVAPLYGRLIDKGVNPITLCIIGCALCFIGYLIIGPVPFLPFKTSLPVIIVALVLLGFGLGIKVLSAYMHGMKQIMSRGFPDNVSTYALYAGLMSAVNSAGAFIGPSMGGVLLDHVGYEKGTIVIVVLDGLLIIMTVAFRIKSISSSSNNTSNVASDGILGINSHRNDETSRLLDENDNN